jgi:hypothetical protein
MTEHQATHTVTLDNITVEADDLEAAWYALYRSRVAMLDSPPDQDEEGSYCHGHPADLETVRTWALWELDRLRAQARRQWLPDIFGQSQVYTDKLDQARAYLAVGGDPSGQEGTSPDPSAYPSILGEEAAVRSLAPNAMARLILERAQRWRIASDRIEAAALRAEQAIQAAGCIMQIITALVECALNAQSDNRDQQKDTPQRTS